MSIYIYIYLYSIPHARLPAIVPFSLWGYFEIGFQGQAQIVENEVQAIKNHGTSDPGHPKGDRGHPPQKKTGNNCSRVHLRGVDFRTFSTLDAFIRALGRHLTVFLRSLDGARFFIGFGTAFLQKVCHSGVRKTWFDYAGGSESHIDHFGKSSHSGSHFGSTLASFGRPFGHNFW